MDLQDKKRFALAVSLGEVAVAREIEVRVSTHLTVIGSID